jgi:predicted AlkP superfamily phosphohydrolase/phosphomutase
MNHPTKILFLAIDAGDKCLIKKWSEDGTMPILGSLLARGLVGDTKSVEGFYEGSTWPSFYTGLTPARHGFHRLVQIKPGTYEFHRCFPGELITREPFWNHLSSAGKKVAILDIPLAGVSKRLNGIQMVEWGSHDAAYGFHTWPNKLKRDVIKRFGTHPVDTACDAFGRIPQDFSRFRDKLIEGVKRKSELTLHYMKRCEWDFFAQVFTEGHCAGHQCWHLHDPKHPNYDRNVATITGDPIREVYKAIDSAIGRILTRIDDKTIVFILATHRMAHNIGASFLLEDILEKMNYLKRNSLSAGSKQEGGIRRIVSIAKGEWKKLPDPIREALKPALFPLYNIARQRIIRNGFYSISSRIDLTNCKCFPHENGNLVSGIRINLLGREPNGVVKAGEELEYLCRTISSDLLNVVDKDSGKPIVKRVLRTTDYLQGEYIDHLPDLLVEWREDKLIGSKALSDNASSKLQLTSDKIGMVEGEYTYCRTGDHRPEGLFIVSGAGINPGVIERTISIMDFAPTFLNLFGIKNPDLDGKPISEIVGCN